MLISRFNRLIRNRFVWGAFAVLVSITFVGFFTDLKGCERARRGRDDSSAGTLEGEPVPYADFLTARFHALLRFRLMAGEDFTLTPEMDRLLHREAWKRLAVLRLVRKLDIEPSDAELAAYVQRDPIFQENGRFTRNRYYQVMAFLSRQFRIAPHQYEAFLREEMAIDKVRRAVSAASWSAPYEVERLVRNFSDLFTVEFIEVPFITFTREVTVSNEEVRALYDANPELFRIPEQVQVAFVDFPFADFKADTVSAESITNFYAEHVKEFYTTNAAGEPILRPLEEVEETIRKRLSAEIGQERAYDAAARFCDSLLDRSDSSNFFEEAAASLSKTVQVTRFFSMQNPPSELGVGADFAAAAFALRPVKHANFSEPLKGSNAFFVIAHHAVRPSRIPPFEEVEEQVRDMALRKAQARALQKKSEAAEKTIRTALAEGLSFVDAVRKADLPQRPVTEGPFTAFKAPSRLELPRLISAITSCEAMETTPFVVTDRETLILARVIRREPGDPTTFDPIRQQIRASLNRRHAQLVVAQWEEDLLAQMNWHDASPPPASDEDSQEEMDDSHTH